MQLLPAEGPALQEPFLLCRLEPLYGLHLLLQLQAAVVHLPHAGHITVHLAQKLDGWPADVRTCEEAGTGYEELKQHRTHSKVLISCSALSNVPGNITAFWHSLPFPESSVWVQGNRAQSGLRLLDILAQQGHDRPVLPACIQL